MSVSDTYVANDVVYRVLENGNADAAFPTLTTSQFTTTEIIDCLNRVQQGFLLDTGCIITRTTIVGQVGKPKYDLPANSIRPRRLTWSDASESSNNFFNLENGSGNISLENGGNFELELGGQVPRVLTQADTWELDTGAGSWPGDRDIPIAWWETTLPQQQVALAKTPLNDGTIGLMFVALAQTLTGAGINLTVPDDFTPYILWGTLAELLSSDGPSFDPVRAQYCTQRYEEGVELCRLILGGQ